MPTGQYATEVNPNPVTVDYLLKNPQVLRRRFTQDLGQKGYISEAILQGGYTVEGGAIRYNRDESLFPDKEGGRRTYEIVAEGARFPLIGPQAPTEQVEKSAKHGLRMFVTWEQIKRNQVAQVEKDLRYLKNELIDYVDNLFMQKFLTDTTIPSINVTTGVVAQGASIVGAGPFSTGATGVFSGAVWGRSDLGAVRDIMKAKSMMTNLRRGFRPDTLLVNDNAVAYFGAHDQLWKLFAADPGDSQPVFTGQMPGKLAGLDVLYTPFIPSGSAFVMQRKMLGGYGDERPESIQVLPFDEDREVQQIKASRVMAFFIDEPAAAIRLTGLGSLV